MHTVPPSADSGPPPVITPYFLRCAEFRRAVEAEAATRGLPPDPLAA